MGITNRLLLVEPSATMRYVLEKHAQSLGFTVDATNSYALAMDSLGQQYQHFGSEYSGMLFGWPSVPQDDATSLAAMLEQTEYKDLPVVVMSTDMRAETRAWVAGRDSTAVLNWKEYQALEALLQRLIDVPSQSERTFPAKFDNSDIHLMVVDDSATIRYSLRDLFQMQGYRVSLAATQDEAMAIASDNTIDIAVLDFYLEETTGDHVCRQLMVNPGTDNIVCTVLTGTYSDHIIKRSLRAGAVECMFKNESSELLLSRIDAISRFVRQRRALQTKRVLLEEVIDSVAGAVVVIDEDHRISYLSRAALAELQVNSAASMIGQPSETLLEIGGPQKPGAELHNEKWRLPDGTSFEVDYEHVLMEQTGRSLIRFARKKILVEDQSSIWALSDRSEQGQTAVASVKSRLGLADEAEPFIEQLQQYLERSDSLSERVSLLVLDVFKEDGAGTLIPVNVDKALNSQVGDSLNAIYRRDGHVARLLNNRFAFLLRHYEESQAYLLTRKIMQLCLQIQPAEEPAVLACTGSLLSVVGNAEQPAIALLQHAFKGVELVNTRGPNQALLLDLRRMLSAYPASKA